MIRRAPGQCFSRTDPAAHPAGVVPPLAPVRLLCPGTIWSSHSSSPDRAPAQCMVIFSKCASRDAGRHCAGYDHGATWPPALAISTLWTLPPQRRARDLDLAVLPTCEPDHDW